MIRLRLVHTLSLLLLATVLLSVIAMGGVTAWNLRSGFADYLAARDVERLEQFAALVAQTAAQQGGADGLRSGRVDMHQLLARFAQIQGLVGRPAAGLADPPPGRPDRPGPPGRFGGGPPGGPEGAGPPGQSDGPRGGPRGGPPGGPDGFGARVVVLSPSGERLFGPRLLPGADAYVERPIRLNGEVIALARMRPGARVPDAVDSRFLRSQYLGIIAVALGLLLFALACAYWVARRWVGPLQGIQQATTRIARGEFDVRVGTDRRGVARSDEIGDVERDINLMAESLQRLESSRRRWLADISHELRTPLTVLRGEIEALVDGVRPLNPEAMVSLREDALRLGALIDDLHLLAMSDLQSLPCQFTDFDAVPFINKLARRFADRAVSKGLSLDLEIESTAALQVCWDRTRIEQLLGNLLENSLRYTDAPGRIRLALRNSGTHVQIDIDDSAPAVPSADLPRLFEPLYRSDAARSRHRGGSGLGLAICDAIVRSHRGKISASASALGGLHLQIELPIKAEEVR